MDLSRAHWRKSSRSKPGGECVELAFNLSGVRAVRDSKDPDGSPLVFEPAALAAFVAAVKGGRFDR